MPIKRLIERVPGTDRSAGDPVGSPYLIDANYRRLCFRAKRFNLPQGHAERPRSLTRRLVTNVLMHGELDQFVGRYEPRLLRSNGGIKFLQWRSLQAMSGLRPVGTVSIIV